MLTDVKPIQTNLLSRLVSPFSIFDDLLVDVLLMVLIFRHDVEVVRAGPRHPAIARRVLPDESQNDKLRKFKVAARFVSSELIYHHHQSTDRFVVPGSRYLSYRALKQYARQHESLVNT